MESDRTLSACVIETEGLCPYVGLRPFDEKDKRFFYGRERDSQLLRNRILSAQLTLLYAPSGVGKTSLLRVNILPELNQPSRRTRPIYLDRWDSVDPIAAIADLIAPMPEGGGSRGNESILLDRLEAALRTDNRTPVLLLDQFERFLLGHPEKWADFGRELGALLRGGQCRVVLSLREEFLATLNAFRDQVPMLMDSTFRLEFFNGATAAAAIRMPAKEAGATIDELLTKHVLQELEKAARESQPDRLLARPPNAIDLPLLQLACERLWKASDGRVLDADLYDRVYEGKSLREDFERRLETGLSREQGNNVALVLDKLAPRTGIKHTFCVDDLVTECDLTRPCVEAALSHLDTGICKVLWQPQPEAYELVHDAFARLLRPWIERRLEAMKLAKRSSERLRQQRNRLWGTFAVLLVAVVVFGSWLFSHNQHVARTKGQLDELRKMRSEERRLRAEPILSNVASYLWSQNKQVELVDLLAREEYAELVPSDFGLDPHLREAIPEVRTNDEFDAIGVTRVETKENMVRAPVTTLRKAGRPPSLPDSALTKVPKLHFKLSESWSKENDYRLLYAWRIVASELNNLGLPVPLQLALDRDPNLNRDQLLIDVTPTSSDTPKLKQTLRVPVYRESGYGILVTTDLNPDQFEGLPEKLKRAMVPVPIESGTKRAWLVPGWTLPIWQVRGNQVFPAEYSVALVASDFLRRNAQVLIDDAFVERFLARARNEGNCDSIVEAKLARGGQQRLREDLIELVRREQSIGSASHVLNALANFPHDILSANVPAEFQKHATPNRDNMVAHYSLRDAECQPMTSAGGGRTTEKHKLVLRGTRELLAAFRTQSGNAKPEVLATIESARRDAYSRTGLVPALVQIEILQDAGMNCEAELQTAWPGRKRQIVLTPCGPQALASWLNIQLFDSAHRMLNAELVRASIEQLPIGVSNWLFANYSLTDLKLALRHTLSDKKNKPDEPPSAKNTPIAERQTLRHLPWLLGSMVFWHGVCARTDARCLGEGLRETQAARLATTRPDGRGRSNNDLIAQGIEELIASAYDARRVGDVATVFADAAHSDPEDARRRFVLLWAERARPIQEAQLVLVNHPLCRLPAVANAATAVPPGLQAVFESTDFLASTAGAGIDTEAMERRRRLQLCRDWGRLSTPATAEAGESLASIAFAPDGEGWTSEERYLAGFWILQAVRRGILPPEFDSKAAQLLATAMKGWTNEQRYDRFSEIASLCVSLPTTSGKEIPRAQRSCLRALAGVAEAIPSDVSMPLLLGWYWATSLNGAGQADAYRALALVQQAEQNATKASPADKDFVMANSFEARAAANYQLAFTSGEEQSVVTAISLNKKLLDSLAGKDKLKDRSRVLQKLTDLHLLRRDYREAENTILKGLREDPDNEALWQTRSFSALAMGRAGDALEYARDAPKTLSESPEVTFSRVLMRLLLWQNDDDTLYEARGFLASGHDYSDYIRLIMFWRMGGPEQQSAKDILDERWRTIDPETWSERLAKGDIKVWRERLIAFYKDKIKREELLGLVDNEEKFENSDMGDLGQTRADFLAEFHFYDALKQSYTGNTSSRQEGFRAALQKTVESNAVQTWEYHMANCLLRECDQSIAIRPH